MCSAAEPCGKDMEYIGAAEEKENLSVSWGAWVLNTDPERSLPLLALWFVKKFQVLLGEPPCCQPLAFKPW